jgi:anti-sigma regulatory factor (Ser/Thr protein kinase)
LTALGWPAAAVEDVVFAVSEAVSNCTEHAYPGGVPDPVVEIDAVVEPAPAEEDPRATGAEHEQRTGQRLTVEVRDHGTWRAVPPDPGHRGRGVRMMVALMNDVVIRRGDAGRPGTEVVLVSPTVFPALPA